MRYVRFNCLDI